MTGSRRPPAIRTLLEQSAALSDAAIAAARLRVHAGVQSQPSSTDLAPTRGEADFEPDLAAMDEMVLRAWAESRGVSLAPGAMIPESVITAFDAEQRFLAGISPRVPPGLPAVPVPKRNPVVAVLLPEGTLLFPD